VVGLTLWLKADGTLWQDSGRTTPATANADPVGCWDDASGNGNHFNGGNPPSLRTNVQNSKPVIRFDGVNDFLTHTAISMSDFSIFMVAKRATTGDYALLGGAASSPQWRLGQGGVNKLSTYDGTNNPQSSPLATDTTTTFTVLEFVRASSTVSFYQDGAAAGTGTMSGAQSLVYLTTFNAGSSFFAGDIGEIVIYNSSLSTGNRQSVEAYLKTKWATP
jgi:hypothetical protein